jgi:hypothetical protein
MPVTISAGDRATVLDFLFLSLDYVSTIYRSQLLPSADVLSKSYALIIPLFKLILSYREKR